jgi:hypothetical protein
LYATTSTPILFFSRDPSTLTSYHDAPPQVAQAYPPSRGSERSVLDQIQRGNRLVATDQINRPIVLDRRARPAGRMDPNPWFGREPSTAHDLAHGLVGVPPGRLFRNRGRLLGCWSTRQSTGKGGHGLKKSQLSMPHTWIQIQH